MERGGGGPGRDLWHPGCCHICGSGMLVNNAGHDNSKGEAYEGCTMAGCRRRKEIKQAGPCRSCDHLMGYLDQGPKGAFRSLPVPTGHLASDCPLSKGTTEHPVGVGVQAGAYTALKVFLTNLSRRTEAKFANIIRDINERDEINRQKNSKLRKGGGPRAPVGAAQSGFSEGGWKVNKSPTPSRWALGLPQKQHVKCPNLDPNPNPNPTHTPDPSSNPNPTPTPDHDPNPLVTLPSVWNTLPCLEHAVGMTDVEGFPLLPSHGSGEGGHPQSQHGCGAGGAPPSRAPSGGNQPSKGRQGHAGAERRRGKVALRGEPKQMGRRPRVAD